MNTLGDLFQRIWTEEDAEVAVEYGLLLALVALGLAAVFTTFSTAVGNWFGDITNTLANTVP